MCSTVSRRLNCHLLVDVLVCVFVRSQIHDYYICIHLNDSTRMWKYMMMMMKIIVCLRSPHYVKGLMLNALIIKYQEVNVLGPHLMFEQRCSTFNEEAGEILLSVLARVTKGDSNMHDIDHCASLFMLSKTYLSLTGNMMSTADFEDNTTTVVDPLSNEVTRLATFLMKHIQSIRRGKFVPYRKLDKSSSSYSKFDSEDLQRSPLECRRLFESQDAAVFDYLKSKAMELMDVDVSVVNADRILGGDVHIPQPVRFDEHSVVGDSSDGTDSDSDDQPTDATSSRTSSDSDDSETSSTTPAEDDDVPSSRMWVKSVITETRVRKVNLMNQSKTVPKKRTPSDDTKSDQGTTESRRASKRNKPTNVSVSVNADDTDQPSPVPNEADASAAVESDGVIRDVEAMKYLDMIIVRPINQSVYRFWVGEVQQVRKRKADGTHGGFTVKWMIASSERGPYVWENVDGKPRLQSIHAGAFQGGFKELTLESMLPDEVWEFVNGEMMEYELVQQRKTKASSSSKK